MTKDFDLDAFTPYRLAVAADRMSTGLSKLYRAEFGISIPEWRVLVHISHAGSVSVRDIAQKTQLEKSRASRAASRLEADGYVKKATDEDDRRLVALTLTAKGSQLMDRLLPIAGDYQARLNALLGQDLKELETALDKIMANEI